MCQSRADIFLYFIYFFYVLLLRNKVVPRISESEMVSLKRAGSDRGQVGYYMNIGNVDSMIANEGDTPTVKRIKVVFSILNYN